MTAFVDGDGRVLRRVRRVRQLHAAQPQEVVPSAVEPRHAHAPGDAVPEPPVPRRRWRELNPSMQAHAGEPLLVLQTPKALQCARLVQHKS